MRKAMQSQVFEATRSAEKTLQLATTLVVAGTTIVVAQHHYGALLALPGIIGVLFTYQLQLYSNIWPATWRENQLISFLEDELGEGCLGHDAGETRHERSNPSIVLMRWVATLALISSIAAAGVVLAHGHYSGWAIALFAFFTALVLLALAFAAAEQVSGYVRAEFHAQLMQQTPPPDYNVRTDAMVIALGRLGRAWVAARRHDLTHRVTHLANGSRSLEEPDRVQFLAAVPRLPLGPKNLEQLVVVIVAAVEVVGNKEGRHLKAPSIQSSRACHAATTT
jgi:hypothetical protein